MSVHWSTALRRAGRPPRRAPHGMPRALALALLGVAGAVSAAIPAPDGPRLLEHSAPSGRALPGDGELRVLQGRQVSMDEAIDMAQRRFNARVVRAEVVERGGRRVYVLRLLSDDGRVFNVRVDAATGSMQ